MAVAKAAWRTRLRQRVTGTRTYAQLIRRLSPDLLTISRSADAVGHVRVSNVDLRADVLVFFPDDATKLYQLEQWLPVLERVTEHRLVVMTRSLGTFNALQDQTKLSVVYVRRLRDLNEVLQNNNFKVCFYTNNSALNFQLLSWSRALHIHLNHGESDKVSMASNQAKAYDYVFVAGQAAVDRYVGNLLNFDETRLVRVGRPQLDLDHPAVLGRSDRPTVLYAPTWEGETDAMDYSSLPVFGVPLVHQLLTAPDRFRVVYKPHPKVLTGSPVAVAAHHRITQMLRTANSVLPSADWHVVEMDASILSVFRTCDVLVSDVSSVALDWLYLHTERPVWVTNPHNDLSALLHASPLAAASYIVDRDNLPTLGTGIGESIAEDTNLAARQKVRSYYFDDVALGMSTRRFLDALQEKVAERNAALAAQARSPHPIEIVAGAS